MKQVFGVGKIHDVTELARKAGHCTRVREDGSKYRSKHIDESLSKYNKYELAADPQQALARYREALEGAKQYNTKRQVIATDIILGASPGFADRTTKEGRAKWQELLEKQVAFFKQRHGEENVVSVSYHYDEVAHPHAHVLVVPRHTRQLKSGIERDYISHRHFYGDDKGKTVDNKLYKLHTRLHEEVSKDFGLERGTPMSLARHQDVKKFHNMVNDFTEWSRLKPKQILAQAMYLKQANEHRVQPVNELTKERDALQRENEALKTELTDLRVAHDAAVREASLLRSQANELQHERDEARALVYTAQRYGVLIGDYQHWNQELGVKTEISKIHGALRQQGYDIGQLERGRGGDPARGPGLNH